MGARSIASATVSFGLVSLPVKVFTSHKAAEEISFRMLHKDCGSRLRQQYVCIKDGQIVERDQMAKGYEFAKDQYVLFSDEEIKALAEESTQTIAISEFVPVAQIDPVFYDKTYYLAPDKGGDRAYRLLAEAMRQAGLCALARYAARGKQYLVMLRPLDGGLAMHQLHFAHEVRPFSEVPLGETLAVKEQELKLALQLIAQGQNAEFKPEAYADDVRDRMAEAIREKIEGRQVTLAPAQEPKAQVIDLLAALKASLAAGDGERRPAKASPRKPAARKSKKSEQG